MILNKKIYLLILIIFTYSSFILGFIFNENSAGAGSYDGDITWIWKNIQIFENNNLIQAINHPDFFGNRTPLSYILHKYFYHRIYLCLFFTLKLIVVIASAFIKKFSTNNSVCF